MSESLLTLWINSETNTLIPNWNSGGTMTLPPFKQGDKVKLEIHWVRSDNGNQFMEEVVIPTAAQMKVAIGVVNGGPSGGSFIYSFEGDTAEIPYNSTAAQVQTLLNGLPSITAAGGVAVSLINQRTYRIVFNEFGSRVLPTCDSTGLTPSTTIFIARISTGSPTAKEVHHLRPKLNPVAYSDSFTDTEEPEIAISEIDDITNRIEISPAPKYGTFTITNGTLTTGALSIYSSASSVQDALTSSGISNTTRSYSVAKSGEFSWDIYRTKGTSETLSVSDSGIVGFSSKSGEIDLNTIEVEDLLAGAADVNAVLEVEYSFGTVKQTIYQGNIRIVNDLIDNATYNPIPFPLPLEDAPTDGLIYGRQDGDWVQVTGGGGGGIPEAPADGGTYGRKDSQWTGVYSESETDTLLSGKADSSHSHSISDVTGLQTALDGKSSTSHNHSIFTLNGVSGGSASYDDGEFLMIYKLTELNPPNVFARSTGWWDFSNLSNFEKSFNGDWIVNDFENGDSFGTFTVNISFSKITPRINTGFVSIEIVEGESISHTWQNGVGYWNYGNESYGDILTVYLPAQGLINGSSYSADGLEVEITKQTTQGSAEPYFSNASFAGMPYISDSMTVPQVTGTSGDVPVMKRGLLGSFIQELVRQNAFSFIPDNVYNNYLLQFNTTTNEFSLSNEPIINAEEAASQVAQKVNRSGDTMTGPLVLPSRTSTATRGYLNLGTMSDGIGAPSSGNLFEGDIYFFDNDGSANNQVRLGYTAKNISGTLQGYTIPTLQQSNQFTNTNQFVVTTTTPAVRISQAGAGYALVVEDETPTPDTTSTIIDGSGNIGVGVSNATGGWSAVAKVDIRSTTQSCLKLTHTGPSGYCLLVEDEATTDATPFGILYDGRVIVGGVASDEKITLHGNLRIVGSTNGIIFGDVTTQVTAYVPSNVAITGGTINNITIDGGTF